MKLFKHATHVGEVVNGGLNTSLGLLAFEEGLDVPCGDEGAKSVSCNQAIQSAALRYSLLIGVTESCWV